MNFWVLTIFCMVSTPCFAAIGIPVNESAEAQRKAEAQERLQELAKTETEEERSERVEWERQQIQPSEESCTHCFHDNDVDSVMAKRDAENKRRNTPEMVKARSLGSEIYNWCMEHNVAPLFEFKEEAWNGQADFYTFECVEARDRAQCKYGDDMFCPQQEINENRQNLDDELGLDRDHY